MGRRLNGTVPIHEKDGTVTWYGPDDNVPADVAKKIGDHAWVEVEDDEPKAPAKKAAAKKAAPAKKAPAKKAAPATAEGNDDGKGSDEDGGDAGSDGNAADAKA